MAAFEAAFHAGDMGTVIDFLPAKILSSIARQAGVSKAELVAAMKQQVDSALAQVTLVSFGMNVDDATWRSTPDGSRNYALIPTFTVMDVKGTGKIRSEGETLALFDDAEWHLVRVDEASQVQLLTAAYPEFRGVTFTPARLTHLD